LAQIALELVKRKLSTIYLLFVGELNPSASDSSTASTSMKQSVLSMTSRVQLRKLGTKTEARVLFIASSTGRAKEF